MSPEDAGMDSTLVWITTTTDPLTLSCGHTSLGNGYPTAQTHAPPRVGDAYWCEACLMHGVAPPEACYAHVGEEATLPPPC